MKIKQLIEELGLSVDYEKSTCKPDDNIKFYYLKNTLLTIVNLRVFSIVIILILMIMLIMSLQFKILAKLWRILSNEPKTVYRGSF